jgi:polyhydroxyalkanoate synthesis regulator phasin
MIETVKKTLLAGLGAALISKDAVESALHDWIEKGKITPEEARHFAEKLVQTGESQWEKTKTDISARLGDVIQKAPFVRQAELRALEARVAVLEQAALRIQLGVPTNQPSTEND